MTQSQSDLDYFEERVFRPETPCWIWRAHVGRQGYGTWSRNGTLKKPHRVAYELFVGPIPAGLVIHHKCFNRQCVNPEHLEAVTQEYNVLESRSVGVINAARTHCKHGHPFDEENTQVRIGKDGRRWRQCKACSRKASREAVRKKRGSVPRSEWRDNLRASTHCPNGHEWTDENSAVDAKGSRFCRQCRRDASERQRRRAGRLPAAERRALQRAQTHCPNGHEWTEANTYMHRGYRYCRACNAEKALARHRRRKEASG